MQEFVSNKLHNGCGVIQMPHGKLSVSEITFIAWSLLNRVRTDFGVLKLILQNLLDIWVHFIVILGSIVSIQEIYDQGQDDITIHRQLFRQPSISNQEKVT